MSFNNENKEPYDNIYGKILKLHIIKHSNSTEVTLRKLNKDNSKIKCLIVFSMMSIGFLAVICGLFNIKYFMLVLIITSLITWKVLNVIEYEKLLYVPKLGCQITQKYRFGFSYKFVPRQSIQGIFINEVFSKHRVLFVLSILVKNEKDEFIIPLFTEMKPRLKCLEVIYQNLLD